MNNNIHDCDNMTCQLLNPSLERLLQYEDLKNRVYKAEEIYHNTMMNIEKSLSLKSFPLGLFGWTSSHHVYQLLNIEFIKELSKRIDGIDPQIILEVGAGKGLLGRSLIKELDREIILTDDYSWLELNKKDAMKNGVIKMDYKKAINKFKPDLIIASWIPYKRWWTKDFRECDSVKGYILIGEGYGGCTGSDMDWKTLWISNEFENAEKFGICRSDHCFSPYSSRHTNITYFKRP